MTTTVVLFASIVVRIQIVESLIHLRTICLNCETGTRVDSNHSLIRTPYDDVTHITLSHNAMTNKVFEVMKTTGCKNEIYDHAREFTPVI